MLQEPRQDYTAQQQAQKQTERGNLRMVYVWLFGFLLDSVIDFIARDAEEE